jgi:hypothetical protein
MTLDYLATAKKRCNSDEYGRWISGITEAAWEPAEIVPCEPVRDWLVPLAVAMRIGWLTKP